MKKNWISRRGVPIHVLKKVFLMMKLTFLLTVVLQVSTWATGFSQENRVSLQMKDVSLETIILELREQTGIRFFYSIDKIKAIDHLSIDVKNEVLKDVLSRLLEGTGLTYTLLDDVIVIKDLVINQDPVRIFVRLKGWVVDEKKRAMPGVTVKLSGTSLGTATDAKGWFSLQLPVPEGRLEFSFVGFATQIVDFSVRTARDTMRVVLKEDLIKMDEVVVTASKAALFNSQKTGAAQNFNQSQIQATPSVSRSIFDVTKMNPLGVNTASGMSFAGSSNKYNSFQIDGITNNDVFGLSSSGTNGGQAGANPISLEAIEEIQVVIAPYDVRQGGFTGGGINAITKSGTNTFHGSAYWYYNNENFYGKTPGKDAKERKKLGDQSSATYGFTLGGPIVKDKLFFFANYERVKETYPSSNNIGSTESNLDVKEVDQIVNKISQLTGGYNAGGYGPQDIDTYSNKILTRLDWNINEQNKFTVR